MSVPALPGDVVVDLSARTKLRLGGKDRVRFLNGQVSNDVRRASEAQSVYTCVMTIKGKMCADAFVHAAGDYLMVDAEPSQREALAARLGRYIIADDVELEDVTDDFRLFHLLVADGQSTAGFDSFPSDPTLAGEVQALQSARYGQAGIDLFVPAVLGDAFRAMLTGKFRLLDDDEVETLRVLAGVPRWGNELGEDTMPAEAGLEARAVSFDKGCYIGQEVVSRVKSVGHVNWQLRGLRALEGTRLEPGMVLCPLEDDSRRVVGRITTVVPAGRDHLPSQVALGFVRRGWEGPGGRLAVFPPKAAGQPETPVEPTATTARTGAVEICALPFQQR